MAAVPPEELERRRPVWSVLSDLFLDTEQTPEDVEAIVRVLTRSGYHVAELERILEEEVAPLLAGNLLSLAGEWTGFDQEWLEEAIQQHQRLFKKPLVKGSLWLIRGTWEQITRLLVEQQRLEQ